MHRASLPSTHVPDRTRYGVALVGKPEEVEEVASSIRKAA
jgi:hypothetical protein